MKTAAEHASNGKRVLQRALSGKSFVEDMAWRSEDWLKDGSFNVVGRGGESVVFSTEFPSVVGKVKEESAVFGHASFLTDSFSEEEAEMGGVTVPAGSFLTYNTMTTEFLIGKLLGDAVDEGECANFVRFYDTFLSKASQTEVERVILMEEAGTTLEDFLSEEAWEEDTLSSLFLQVLFAIAFYQEKHKVSHNDLFLGNVLVSTIDKDYEFGGEKVSEADSFRYAVGETEVFLPAVPYLAKVVDFGISVKYSEPMLGDKYVLENGYDQDDSQGPLIPPHFVPSYDSAFFSGVLWSALSDEDMVAATLAHSLVAPHPPFTGRSLRPNLKTLDGATTAKQFLEGERVRELFGTRPEGRVVTLGTL